MVDCLDCEQILRRVSPASSRMFPDNPGPGRTHAMSDAPHPGVSRSKRRKIQEAS
jgi:hypothetical protein